MRKFFNILPIASLLLGLISCSEFLDRAPISELDPQNFFRSESEIEVATYNIYTYMEDEIYLKQEHYTDNCYGKKNSDAISYTHGTHTPATSAFLTLWKADYQGIAQANLVINADMSADIDDIKDGYIADALFMRAYYYADLLFHFGEVPILLEYPDVTGDLFPAKSTMEEVKTAILADLNKALINLPDAPVKGRAGKGAAYMLQSKLHMFFYEYAEARDAARAVIDLNQYELFSDFRSLFYEENEGVNKEVIFSIQYMESLRPNVFYQKVTNSTRYAISISLADEFEMANGMKIDESGSGYDSQQPFLNRDPRYNVSILTPGDSREIDGVVEPLLGRAPSSKTAMIGDKYQKWGENYDFYNGSDFILMRYADALLLYAEALNEAEATPNSDVYWAVNEVRGRVDLPNLPEGLSQDEMRTRIRHERRVELANEGQRLFDIFRWKIGEEAMIPLKGYDAKKLKDLDNLTFKTKTIDSDRTFNSSLGYFWPIPQTEIDLNQNLVQNPNFTN